MYIESKVNANTERTGLLMSVNEDALQVISYDKNGVDIETGNKTVQVHGYLILMEINKQNQN